eukprot:Gb_36679 [translate_table: standard]
MGDIFEDENEPTVTMTEYIEGVEAQELEADLVLGGDEGKECTYSKGYMNRQAVFSCLTCVPAGNAGICTACSLTCHDGHEVVELWTRRRFRCDCGNSKFGNIHCKLVTEKDPENKDNAYNQNYKGLYCTCHRPYPDPEGEDQGEMIQCCICEDWFHENHLGLETTEQIPRDDEGEPIYEDFVCQDCASRCSFLSFYKEIIVIPSILVGTSANNEIAKQHMQEEAYGNSDARRESLETVLTAGERFNPAQSHVPSKTIGKDNEQLKKPTSVINDSACDDKHLMQCNFVVHGKNHLSHEAASTMTETGQTVASEVSATQIKSSENSVNEVETCSEAGSSTSKEISITGQLMAKSNPSSEQVIEAKKFEGQESRCKLMNGADIPLQTSERKKALFLARNWRDLLCRCNSCYDLCTAMGVTFLLDKGDTLEEYENIAKQRREEKLQQQEGVEVAFLQNLGHTQQIELLSGINDMKNELRSFLESLDTTKAVTGADIREVFDNLKRKRQRLI